jgi:hypothetical protein
MFFGVSKRRVINILWAGEQKRRGDLKETNHIIVFFVLLRLPDLNVQAFPNIFFQLPHVYPFGTFGIIDKFWSNPPRLTLRGSQEVLLSSILHCRTVAIKSIVKARAVIIVIVEELGIEGYVKSITGLRGNEFKICKA